MIKKDIQRLLEERILLLDGAFGTMIQRLALEENDFRGERFAAHPRPLKGCNDVLVLTRPDVVAQIHRAYLDAGADIISTDSFNANALSMRDYGLSSYAREIARASAVLAREAADEYTALNPAKPRLVAGSVGPTNKTSSIPSDMEHPERRETTFDELVRVCKEQISGLVEGGADIILIETVFDTLNAKAALYAAAEVGEERGMELPIMLSGTPADAAGRMLSGQSIEAFYTSVSHAPLLSIGFNCAFGAEKMLPFLERMADISEFPVSAHPNAGLPNIDGGYDVQPEMFAAAVETYLQKGLVNIIGGCCGTTPEHIALLAPLAERYSPRPLPERSRITRLSGLDELQITPRINFVNIGERTNVAGSARFARMIREGDMEGAVAVARAQVDAGAQIVDVCMDDGMIDGGAAMERFLTLLGGEPEIARVPVMIDSSSWETIERGLKVVQGKCIVNSVSLKDGEAALLEKARAIRRYGAAVVVMLFDERGQATSFGRKTEIARRAYDLLVGDGFPAEDIVFDPNILAVATGIGGDDLYARAYIDAVRWIKENLPQVKVSGGVSNLSFAFRGNNAVREAMHSVFLHHAIAAGMDMGIVNPQMLAPYELIDPELRVRAEDLILARREDAAERLAEYAQRLSSEEGRSASPQAKWRSAPLAERIGYAMQRGIADYIEEDIAEALQSVGKHTEIIDTILMPAMEHIGVLFGDGKMFLPQVIKSASVMKRAIAVLTPLMQSEGESERAKGATVVLATVKGDVHDIGKNIVAVIAACNGFEVADLGVSVDAGRIVDEAVARGAAAICLSGLITPSLEEMRRVCILAQKRGLRIPVIVGGAATSELHTAVKMAPLYSGVVVCARNAGDNIRLLSRLTNAGGERESEEIKSRQKALREAFERGASNNLLPLDECRRARRKKDASMVAVPLRSGRILFDNVSVVDVEPYIDWNFFFSSWEVKGRWPAILEDPERGGEARKIYDDAQRMLNEIKERGLLRLSGVAGIYPAVSRGDDIVVKTEKGEYVLPMLRNQSAGEKNLSLADFILDEGCGQTDFVGCFALTAGIGLGTLCERLRAEGRDYDAVTAKLVADRLAEAFAEYMHLEVRRRIWGYESGPEPSLGDILHENYRGRRMAFGYPAAPDHSLKREVFDILGAEQSTGMRLGENYMIEPGESLCGLFFADGEYFSVGRIDFGQLEDYAARRGKTPDEVRKIIPHNIAE